MTQTDAAPDISVIIPFYNRKEMLPVVLEAVRAQQLSDPNRSFEIIAVDNGSTDGTRELLAEQPNLRVVDCATRGPAAARNAGIAVARGELLVFTDSDCEPQPDWLDRLTVPLFDDPNVIGTGGRIDALFMNNGVEIYSQVAGILNQYAFYQGVLCFPPYFATANACWRHTALQAVNGFNEHLLCAEDCDLSWRICARGGTIVYVDTAVVKHAHRHTIMELFRQGIGYGEAAVQVFAMHHEKMSTGRIYINWDSYYQFVIMPVRCIAAILFGRNGFQKRAPIYEWIWRGGNLYGNIKEGLRHGVVFFP